MREPDRKTMAAPAANPAETAALGHWALALVPALMLAVLLLRATTNSDLFWQVRLGEMTLDSGGPVVREPFSALHLGEPIAALSWLGHALMALALRHSGWEGLRLLDAASWCAGFWVIVWICRKQGASALGLAAVLLLAFVIALPTAIMRPQSFAVLCFGLLLALLRADLRTWTKLLLAVPLFLLWQNLHPSVSLAVAVAGSAAAGGWFAWFRARSRSAPLPEIPWAESLITPLAAIAIFCTPDGATILAISASNTEMSMLVGASEWYPLWHRMNHSLAVLIAVVAGFSAWVVWQRRARVNPRELAAAIALGLMTLLIYRFVVFWAMALIPLLARTGIPVIEALRLSGGARAVLARQLPAASAAIAVAITAITATWFYPATFRPHLALPTIAKLRDHNIKGTVFADFPLGGPVIHIGHPHWKVAYDGRYYQYSRAEWLRFAAIQSGRMGLDEIERIYRPSAFVLNIHRNGHLIAAIAARSGDWREAERSERVVIFVRRD